MLKRKAWIACFLIMIIMLGGCSQEQPSTPTEAVVTEFSLGKGTLTEQNGDISIPLDGLMGIPVKDNCPVVFILHGAHAPTDITEDRFYRGFRYLTESLARQGYLAISINLNQAYSFEPFEGNEYERAMAIFQQFYDKLQQANEGKPIFDYNIKDKADFDSLNFIGHSRGGDNSLYIADQLSKQGEDVNSVLTVSSPNNIDFSLSQADFPIGIILSQYDGDVVDLSSASLFSGAYYEESGSKEYVTMAFLYGANHSQFNTEIPQVDFPSPIQNVTYLEGDVQRNFLALYAADFLRCFNEEDQDIASLLGNTAPSRLGIDFMPSVLLPDGISILPDSDMTGIISSNMKLSEATLSNIPDQNTIAPFNPPGALSQDILMYRISWKEKDAEISFPLAKYNLEDKKYLSLYIANDSTAHSSGQPLSLEVRLTDHSGNTAAIAMDQQSSTALRYIDPFIENVFEGMENMPEYLLASRHTPLGIWHIPLSDFGGVDMSSIQNITLTGKSESGDCILGGIRFE